MTNDEAAALVRKWLSEEKIPHEDTQDEYAAFNIRIETAPGRPVHVFCPKGYEGRVLIMVNMAFGGSLPKAGNRKKLMIAEMELELARMKAQHEPVSMPEGRIRLGSAVYHDGLTKDTFFRRLVEVDSAIAMVQIIANKYSPGGSAPSISLEGSLH